MIVETETMDMEVRQINCLMERWFQVSNQITLRLWGFQVFLAVPNLQINTDKCFRYLNLWTLITMVCQSANVIGSLIY